MKITRRKFVVGAGSLITAACANQITAPSSSTTPLLVALRRDGYTVVEQKNLAGGVALMINGKLPNIKVGDKFIGIDPNKSGAPTFNVGLYEVPDSIGYILLA